MNEQMDAFTFVRERNRMCTYYSNFCGNCPAKDCACDKITEMYDDYDIIPIVEQWAAEHPVKTRQEAFVKMFPDAMCDSFGILNVCPKSITGDEPWEGACRNGCRYCRQKFWSQEVE